MLTRHGKQPRSADAGRARPTGRAAWPLLVLLLLSLVSAATPQEKKARTTQPAKPETPPAPAEQDDVVTLRADLVVVSVTVTDAAGNYARGLKAKDFALFEDDATQTINSFTAEEAPFAAAILIDMSGSMEYKFGQVRGAAAAFIDHIRDDDQVAVYGFNNKVRQVQDFSNLRDIADAIWDAKAEDRTRLYDCMDEAVTALAARPEKRRAILLISDGWDNTSAKATYDSAMKRALAAGVVVYTVDLIDDDTLMGGGDAALMLRRGRNELKEFAAQTGGRYVHTPQGNDLESAFANIVDELRNQYTLTFYPTNKKRDGRWRRLTVTARGNALSVRARRGYYAPKS
ncbi:MAG TPA: VWA domain-containing protein [Blastocatellia bacterium]|nr:VWA domain-containing protein [Blastocatellia bacterium]